MHKHIKPQPKHEELPDLSACKQTVIVVQMLYSPTVPMD